MKKIIIRGLIILLILIVVAFVAVGVFLNDGIKAGIQTLGPRMTKTAITVDSVRLSLLSGAGAINGLVVGNPPGYKAQTAISIGSLRLGIEPASLLADKIVIRGIRID